MQVLNTDKLVEIFYFCDEFDKVFQPYCQQKLIGKAHQGKMNKAEMMSIMVYYHLSGFKCFNRVAGRYYYNRRNSKIKASIIHINFQRFS